MYAFAFLSLSLGPLPQSTLPALPQVSLPAAPRPAAGRWVYDPRHGRYRWMEGETFRGWYTVQDGLYDEWDARTQAFYPPRPLPPAERPAVPVVTYQPAYYGGCVGGS